MSSACGVKLMSSAHCLQGRFNNAFFLRAGGDFPRRGKILCGLTKQFQKDLVEYIP